MSTVLVYEQSWLLPLLGGGRHTDQAQHGSLISLGNCVAGRSLPHRIEPAACHQNREHINDPLIVLVGDRPADEAITMSDVIVHVSPFPVRWHFDAQLFSRSLVLGFSRELT